MELLLWILVWSELVVFGALLGAFLLLSALNPLSRATLHRALDPTRRPRDCCAAVQWFLRSMCSLWPPSAS